MSRSLYIYENEEEIHFDLKCVICFEPFQFPVSDLGCSHIFCCRCIQLWLMTKRFCPLCRHPFTKFRSLENEKLFEDLQHLPVRCNFCQTGKIEFKKFSNHKLFECPEKIDVNSEENLNVDDLNVLFENNFQPRTHHQSSPLHSAKLPVWNIFIFIFFYIFFVLLIAMLIRYFWIVKNKRKMNFADFDRILMTKIEFWSNQNSSFVSLPSFWWRTKKKK